MFVKKNNIILLPLQLPAIVQYSSVQQAGQSQNVLGVLLVV